MSQQWSSSDIARFPISLILGIILVEFRDGNYEKAKELLRVGSMAHPDASLGSNQIIELKNFLIKTKQNELFKQLKTLAPQWFQSDSHHEHGGICMAVIMNNMGILKELLDQKPKTLDSKSAYDVSKLLPSYTYSYSSYDSKSAFYWSVHLKNLPAFQMFLDYNAPLIITKTNYNTSSRKQSEVVVSEDIWGEIVKSSNSDMAQIIFEHPHYKEQIFKSIMDLSENAYRPKRLLYGLSLLNATQQQLVFESISSTINKYWKTCPNFRRILVEDYPERYINIFNQEQLHQKEDIKEQSLEDFQNACIHGPLSIVKTIASTFPQFLSHTWEDFPAATRHTKRQRGCLSFALGHNNSEIVEFLSTQPGVMESETKLISEYFSKGWMQYDKTHYRYHSSSITAEEKKHYNLSLKSLWEKTTLNFHVQENLHSPKTTSSRNRI